LHEAHKTNPQWDGRWHVSSLKLQGGSICAKGCWANLISTRISQNGTQIELLQLSRKIIFVQKLADGVREYVYLERFSIWLFLRNIN
jgi:hypothetical protein